MPPVLPPLLTVLALISTPVVIGALVLWSAHRSDKAASRAAGDGEATT